jgi:serine/threonine-protein kinase
MDYVAGTDVGRLLREQYQRGMPVDEVASITTAVGSALDYAHRRGLLHRDVKPANISVVRTRRAGPADLPG